jgi:hypothetical protein
MAGVGKFGDQQRDQHEKIIPANASSEPKIKGPGKFQVVETIPQAEQLFLS